MWNITRRELIKKYVATGIGTAVADDAFGLANKASRSAEQVGGNIDFFPDSKDCNSELQVQ
jgi:hypothetical protein